ncbi:MAG: hypothetical protein AB1861_20845 [Cyanobacteriota bacterium]
MAQGGKREGAGRKPKGDRPKAKINITIDADLLEWMDSQSDNRSELIEEALLTKKKAITRQQKKENS